MPRTHAKKTTAEDLEAKFGRGEDVLDYFDVRKARVVRAEPKSDAKGKLAYLVKRNANGRAVVPEKSARYRKKK